MNIWIIIIEIMWMIMAATLMFQYIDMMKDLSKSDALVVIIVLFIGAPFFFMVNILEAILDTVFPEGWDDDEDDFFKKY